MVRGPWSILDVHPPSGAIPFHLDLFGDEVERIFEIDRPPGPIGGSARSRSSARRSRPFNPTSPRQLADMLPQDAIVVLLEVAEITEQARGWERIRDATGVFGPPRSSRR